MRLVIELRRGEVAEVVLNNLYKQTQFQTVFGINMVALLDGRPHCMNLKEIMSCLYVDHRREIVTRRTVYLLRKAQGAGAYFGRAWRWLWRTSMI